ncbi:AEC family transporter [[Clostridium] polysaccharolyticum]|uniref:AEC family transporter n=1 Tax=[Clostridium] polysaccharolyticum TaxID=29364 RepID=A0A1H9ZFT9_9FIRM|nr:AEC family transporter [[Clostridium] polysaccharolyticum]SES80465.1 hypothetical protein SAMN04487772_103187 [[Clostridium] polysaccharolyticum]
MKDFYFSLNATMPVFVLMLAGWCFGKTGMLTQEFVRISNKFVFKVALPLLLFRDIATVNIRDIFDIRFVLFCMISTSIAFFGIWGLACVFLKEKTSIGSFVQGSFRGSAAILGVAFIQNMYGNSGMAPMMIIGAVPLFNIYSVIVLTFGGNFQQDDRKNGIQKAFFNILKNPIIIGIFLGMIGSLLHIYEKLPPIVEKPMANMGSMASTLGLLAIGAGFETGKALEKVKPVIWATFLKLVGLPLIFMPAAVALGFRNHDLIAFLIMLGAPTTVTSYIMSVNMNNDGVLASGIVVLSTLLSSITLTGGIYILRVTGLI